MEGTSASELPPPSKNFTMPWIKELDMIYYAVVFLIIGLIAAILGLTGIASVASQIAWVLLLIGVVLLVIRLVRGAPPVA